MTGVNNVGVNLANELAPCVSERGRFLSFPPGCVDCTYCVNMQVNCVAGNLREKLWSLLQAMRLHQPIPAHIVSMNVLC